MQKINAFDRVLTGYTLLDFIWSKTLFSYATKHWFFRKLISPHENLSSVFDQGLWKEIVNKKRVWSGAGFLIKPQVLNGLSAENCCSSLCGDYAIIIQQLQRNCALYVMLMMEFNQFSAISVPYLRNKENKKMLDQNKKAKQYQISNLYITYNITKL